MMDGRVALAMTEFLDFEEQILVTASIYVHDRVICQTACEDNSPV